MNLNESYKRYHRTTFSLLLISTLLTSMPSFSKQKGIVLTVKVSGADFNTEQALASEADRGQVILSLFNSPDNYLSQPIISDVKPVNEDGQVNFTFEQLEVGTYALSIIYDEDGNGELNTGFLGIPTELVGFSNNVKGIFGPPSYGEASFILSTSKTIHIVLGKAKE